MKPASFLRSRLAALCLVCVLGACGGGADEPADRATAAAATAADSAASAANGRRTALKAKVRSDDRKGVTAVAVSPDGASIGVANADGSVRVLDGTSAQPKKDLKAPGGALPAGLIFTPDARYLAAVGRDSVAQFWNVDTGQQLFTLRGHEHPLRSVSASADGSVVATGGEETRVLLWDGKTGRLLRILNGGHTDFVTSVSVSPDGRLIASGDADARILVWDAASGTLLQTLRGHADGINAVAFCADSRLLASASEDGRVILWDTVAGQALQALAGTSSPMRSLAFSADGTLLAAGSVDGKVLVWDTAARSFLEDLSTSTATVNAIAFDASKTNRLVIGNAADGVMVLKVSRSVAKKNAGCGATAAS